MGEWGCGRHRSAPCYLRAVPRSPRVGLAALAGVTVGIVVAGLVVGSGLLRDREAPVPKPEATQEFIAAFQRSLDSTYVVRANFTRTLESGRTLESSTFVAQRPPDRIERQFGGITGTVAGHQIMCSGATGGAFHCGPAAAATDANATLAQQLVNLRSYFADPALYRVVRADDECFELTQIRPLALAPYGSSATMCFDPPTGAMRYLTQTLEGATDTFEAFEIRPFASDQDFSLSQDPAYDATSDGHPADDGSSPPDTTPDSTGPQGATTSTTTGA